MRVRDSAKYCAPVCFVQAAAHKHDLENKVKKTFTFVSEQGAPISRCKPICRMRPKI